MISSRLVVPLGAALGLTSGCRAEVTSVGEWHADASSGGGVYVEAESGEVSQGFTIQSDASVSGGFYLASPAGSASETAPGPDRVRYAIDVPARGKYIVWGRIHSPDAIHNRVWFNVDGGTWYVFRISTGDDWYWEPFHDDRNYLEPLAFDLAAGRHELVLADAVEDVGLDRFYFTASGDTPPGNDTPCHPPDSIRRGDTCLPSCGSQGGNDCGITACSTLPQLPAYDCDVCCIGP